MYGKHPNGGMTEIELRNINFIETDFPSIGNANRDLDLYELEEDDGTLPSSSEDGGLVPRPWIANDSGMVFNDESWIMTSLNLYSYGFNGIFLHQILNYT